MLPFSATFTGHLETAEAIYEGSANNLIGIKTFAGEQGNLTPQHAILLGMSGTGKSVTMCDLLSQTEGYFAYTVIIEEGLSYGIYTQTIEPAAKPIIIQPDGNITINYLDTKGLPLIAEATMTETTLTQFGLMAEKHWREFLPNMVREMEAKGILQEMLLEAQEKTGDELEKTWRELNREGYTPEQAYRMAWEMVREKYILLPPEHYENQITETTIGFPNLTA